MPSVNNIPFNVPPGVFIQRYVVMVEPKGAGVVFPGEKKPSWFDNEAEALEAMRRFDSETEKGDGPSVSVVEWQYSQDDHRVRILSPDAQKSR